MKDVIDRWTLGPARRQRRMLQQMEALDREYAKRRPVTPETSWRSWTPLDECPPRPAGVPNGLRRTSPAAIVTVVIGATISAYQFVDRSLTALGFPVDIGTPGVPYAEPGPPPGVGSNPNPLGTPPSPPSGEGGFTFVSDETTPPRYDPCRAIHYVVRSKGESAAERQAVTDAAAGISRATGLQFIAYGSTNEAPADQRATYQPERYGDRWAPLLIAFTDPGEVPSLVGRTIGLGGSASAAGGGETPRVLVTGMVTLDTPLLLEIPADERYSGRSTWPSTNLDMPWGLAT